MEVMLSKRTGLMGVEAAKAWTARVVNRSGETVIEGSAVTSTGALREVERQLEEGLRAVREMMGKSSPASGDDGKKGYQG